MSGESKETTARHKSVEEIECRSAIEAQLQVFFGEATETGCRIYAESERRSEAGATLSGIVRGPFCRYAHTLPVSYSFRQRSGQAGGMVEAWVPDPCFWTPALPFYYEYKLEWDCGDRHEQTSGTIGIRRLGRDGSNLRFDGKRWVLRGARAEELSQSADLSAWHDASLSAVVRSDAAMSIQDATQLGVLMVVEIPKGADVERELRSLRSQAAAAIAILDSQEAPPDPRSIARNLLFAQRFAPGEPIRPDDWADIAVCELRHGAPWSGTVSGRPVPLIAYRPGGKGLLPKGSRAQCDVLQRDLAESGVNWAGYIV